MNEYEQFIGSKKWEVVRKALIAKRGKACEKCGATHNLQIHHLGYGDLDYFNEKDLMIVCADCHNILHQDIEFFV